jgi:hypothetical protein
VVENAGRSQVFDPPAVQSLVEKGIVGTQPKVAD